MSLTPPSLNFAAALYKTLAYNDHYVYIGYSAISLACWQQPWQFPRRWHHDAFFVDITESGAERRHAAEFGHHHSSKTPTPYVRVSNLFGVLKFVFLSSYILNKYCESRRIFKGICHNRFGGNTCNFRKRNLKRPSTLGVRSCATWPRMWPHFPPISVRLGCCW